jgi:hypothetical protein
MSLVTLSDDAIFHVAENYQQQTSDVACSATEGVPGRIYCPEIAFTRAQNAMGKRRWINRRRDGDHLALLVKALGASSLQDDARSRKTTA